MQSTPRRLPNGSDGSRSTSSTGSWPSTYCALIVDEHGEPTWRYRSEFFRAEIDRQGVALNELDQRMGWSAGYASRALGYRAPAQRGQGHISVSYRIAVQLCRVLDLDYVRVGV